LLNISFSYDILNETTHNLKLTFPKLEVKISHWK